MADLKMAKGSCLCGSVSYQFQIAENVFDVCHCSLCRKWTGGPVTFPRQRESFVISFVS